MSMKLIVSICISMFLTVSLYGQITEKEKERLLKKVDRQEKKLTKPYQLIVLPALYYTPETTLAGGATSMMKFKSNRNDSLCKTSQIFANAIYTLNDQIILTLPFQLFLKHNKWFISGEASFFRYPYIFGGIGNEHEIDEIEDYNAYFPRYQLEIMRSLAPKIYLGPGFFYQNMTVTEIAQDGLLDTGGFLGAEGGVTVGFGIVGTYDSRDNQLSPRSGWFIKYGSLHNSGTWGSDFDFSQYTFDLRWYTPILKKHSIAMQLFTQFQDGDVPFNRLSALGGPNLMRGYQLGIYRDQKQAVYQLEWRSKTYFHHIGLRAFGAIGGVGNDLEVLSENLRPTVGGGIRLSMKKDDDLYLRFDAGFGEKTSGIYFSIGEAF